MSTRTIMVVFLALLCGAAMAVGVLQSSRPKTVGAIDVTETEPVLVATADMQVGSLLQATVVEVRQWPKGLAPATTLRTIEEGLDRALVGQVLKDEFVLGAKLAPKGVHGLGVGIPSGWRAYTIQTSRLAANVAGFIMPKNKVDVLLNMKGNRGDETGGGSTMTLLQSVEILAVDQITEAAAKLDPKGWSSVTLLVTLEQANLLDLGQNSGILTLALRNPLDKTDEVVKMATINDIRSRGQPPNESPLNDALNGDKPQLPTAPQTALVTSTPPVREVRNAWVVTLRGNQRGRVLLTGEPDVN